MPAKATNTPAAMPIMSFRLLLVVSWLGFGEISEMNKVRNRIRSSCDMTCDRVNISTAKQKQRGKAIFKKHPRWEAL